MPKTTVTRNFDSKMEELNERFSNLTRGGHVVSGGHIKIGGLSFIPKDWNNVPGHKVRSVIDAIKVRSGDVETTKAYATVTGSKVKRST